MRVRRRAGDARPPRRSAKRSSGTVLCPDSEALDPHLSLSCFHCSVAQAKQTRACNMRQLLLLCMKFQSAPRRNFFQTRTYKQWHILTPSTNHLVNSSIVPSWRHIYSHAASSCFVWLHGNSVGWLDHLLSPTPPPNFRALLAQPNDFCPA